MFPIYQDKASERWQRRPTLRPAGPGRGKELPRDCRIPHVLSESGELIKEENKFLTIINTCKLLLGGGESNVMHRSSRGKHFQSFGSWDTLWVNTRVLISYLFL